MTRRAFLLASAGLLLAACGQSNPAPASPAASTVAVSAAAPKLTALNVGYTTNGLVNSSLWLAKERGFFAQNGLDVTLKSLVANAELPALISGELQYDGSGAAAVVAAKTAQPADFLDNSILESLRT